jgi:hypothetical protein
MVRFALGRRARSASRRMCLRRSRSRPAPALQRRKHQPLFVSTHPTQEQLMKTNSCVCWRSCWAVSCSRGREQTGSMLDMSQVSERLELEDCS